MRRLRTTIFVLLITVIVLGFMGIGYAQENKSMIMIVVNKFDFIDLYEMPNLKGIGKENYMSLINTRALQSYNEYSSNLTIGSSARASASTITSRVFEINDDVKDIYYLRNNKSLTDGKYVNVDLAALKALNEKNNYRPFIGALGDSLKEKGINVYIIGNSNIEDREISFGSLIVMDSNGVVADGMIGEETNVKTNKAPYGYKTNYEKIAEELGKVNQGLAVVELGDLYRLDKYKGYLSMKSYEACRFKMLNEMDAFIKDVVDSNKDKDIIIVSPVVSSDRYKVGERLAPIIYIDRNNEGESGVLTSATTRRKGIIGNLDIAPFIASYFDSNQSNFVGKSFSTLSVDNNYRFIDKLNEYTAFVYIKRSEILSVFAIYEILIVLLIFIVIQLKPSKKFSFNVIFRFLILSNIAIPIALLLLPLFWPDTSFKAIALLLIITAVLTFIAISFKRKRIDGVILLTGLTCVLLAADIVMGSNLIKNGFLGYDPIIGARYYGIGNEYMGILIGCTLVFSTAILDRFDIKKWTVGIIYALIIIVIGYPGFGANVGGSITAVFAFMFVIFKLYNGKLKVKHFVILVLSVPIFIGLLSVIDLFLVKNTSHLGNAINQIRTGGIDVIISIIIRKVSMNIRLFNVSIWSKVLVISLGVLGLLFYRPFGVAKQVFLKYKNLKTGLLGLLVACLVTFVVNDSGVVAAATAVIPLVMTLLYLVFIEIRDL